MLSADEIAVLYRELANSRIRPIVQDIIRLLLETGCRVSEIGELEIAEVDFREGLIRLPSSRVKNGTAHAVPLTDEAVVVLSRNIASRKAGFVFPVDADRPIRGDVVANEIAKAQGARSAARRSLSVTGWTAHDLRRTWATMASELGIAPHVIAAALNHRSVNSGVTFAHYVRNDFLADRRRAHAAVSARLAAIRAEGG